MFYLYGVKAPKLHTQDGMQAKAALEALLHSPGTLEAEVHKSDRYGRYLIMLYKIRDDGNIINLNEEMIRAGFVLGSEELSSKIKI